VSAPLADLRRAARGEVMEQVPLAQRTSVRVGGPARLWVRPADPKSLVDVLGVLSGAALPWLPFGGGANPIVSHPRAHGAVSPLGRAFASAEV
jgi:UDP-N-acetylmuramate dehydrogenase